MAQMTRKPNHILINNASEYPVDFKDDTNAIVAPNVATKFSIRGYSNTVALSRINGVYGVRGAAGTTQQLQLTTANTTINGPVPANTIVTVFFDVTTTNYEAEYARYNGEDGASATFQIRLQTGDTYDIFLAKLYNSILQDQRLEFKNIVKVLTPEEITTGGFGTIVDGFATSITQLDIFAYDDGLIINTFEVNEGNRENPSPFVTANPTTITEQYEGSGTYEVLKNLFVPEVREVRFDTTYMVPFEGSLYTMITWQTFTYRKDLAGMATTDQMITANDPYTLYINETQTQYINDLVDFLDRATVLSTANPALYEAPEWRDDSNPAAVVAAAAFKL